MNFIIIKTKKIKPFLLIYKDGFSFYFRVWILHRLDSFVESTLVGYHVFVPIAFGSAAGGFRI